MQDESFFLSSNCLSTARDRACRKPSMVTVGACKETQARGLLLPALGPLAAPPTDSSRGAATAQGKRGEPRCCSARAPLWGPGRARRGLSASHSAV